MPRSILDAIYTAVANDEFDRAQRAAAEHLAVNTPFRSVDFFEAKTGHRITGGVLQLGDYETIIRPCGTMSCTFYAGVVFSDSQLEKFNLSNETAIYFKPYNIDRS